MTANLNLDALIPREDFEIDESKIEIPTANTIHIQNLETNSFFYPILRKPDFQRETSDWSGDKVFDFIKSFLDNDLIPAIILWKSGSYIFVIDGAHRLSALLSWVHDDYGDGLMSRRFFENSIPEDQLEIAAETRRDIGRSIGSYKDHLNALQNRENVPKDMIDRATRLASLSLILQWVTGNATKAEQSFFKINQEAVPINPTELRLLKSRYKPNALAARAIMRAGTGHKYWSRFENNIQDDIQKIAKETNSALFTPTLRQPIKTLDLPIAGREYSSKTLPLILDFVNISNSIGNENDLANDTSGAETLTTLKAAQKIINRVSSVHASSLGLHPAVYFYSASGRYQPTAFLAIIELVKTFDQSNYYRTFTDHRKTFEDFILKYKTIPNQVTIKWGSSLKGYKYLHDIYWKILSLIANREPEDKIIETLKNDTTFNFINFEQTYIPSSGETFSRETKSAVFLRDALQNPLRCQICQGLIHYNSIQIDHIVRKQDGGLGTMENAQEILSNVVDEHRTLFYDLSSQIHYSIYKGNIIHHVRQ